MGFVFIMLILSFAENAYEGLRSINTIYDGTVVYL